jgi:putative endonuclease
MPKNNPRKQLGAMGEQLAVRELQGRGLTIVQTNYRCTAGEMDVIARDAEEWVFVEVKTRRGDQFGAPEEAVHARKQQKLIEVAETYLQEHALHDAQWRIDVVAVEMDARGKLLRVEVTENAVTR